MASVVALVLGMLLTGSPVCSAALADRHVIVISIDALLPEFCLPSAQSNVCPTLAALREKGSYAKQAVSVYPSLTYPAHASMVTGVTPARHGVTGNTMFAPLTREDARGFWYASDLKAPALWDVLHNAGLSIGAVSWPCSAGTASVAWNLPEFWGSEEGHELSMMRRYTSQEVLDVLEAAARPMTAETLMNAKRRDEFVAACATEIIRRKKPHLTLIHFLEADHHQHKNGRSSPDLTAVMSRIDALVGGIVAAVEQAGLSDRTTFVVTGDHGFSNVNKCLAPNIILRREGFLAVGDGKLTAWSAVVENSGGSAAVYVNPQSPTGTLEAVYALLEKSAQDKEGHRLYSIVEKDVLVRMGGPAYAAFCLEAENGCMFSGSWNGASWMRRSPMKGNHGYFPTNPDMATGFIICGNGIRKGIVVDRISIMDIAPTVAAIFGLRLDNVQGRVLKEILTATEDTR